MNVSRIGANNVAFSAAATATKAPAKTQESKKSGKIVAVGLSALAAIGLAAIAIKKGKAADALPKDFTIGQKNITKLLGVSNARAIEQQIAEVAERTSEKGVATRMAELAEAFGGTVEHVAQKASIVG